MSDEVIRFPAQVPYDKWPAVDLVYGKIIRGDMAGAKAAYDASPQDVKDAVGAVNSWRDQFKPADLVQLPDWEVTQSGNKDFSPEPGKIYWFLSKKTGPASWTPSGGSGYCWISAPDKGSFPTDGNTSAAMGQSGTILVTAGQIVSMKWGNGGVTSGAHYAVQ